MTVTRHSADSHQTPFSSVEDAWFWTVGTLRARRDGEKGGACRMLRPCDPDDILRCLDRLYRNRRIDLTHARVLRAWGERRLAPQDRCAGAHATRLWREAMDRLDPILRQKGIVA